MRYVLVVVSSLNELPWAIDCLQSFVRRRTLLSLLYSPCRDLLAWVGRLDAHLHTSSYASVHSWQRVLTQSLFRYLKSAWGWGLAGAVGLGGWGLIEVGWGAGLAGRLAGTGWGLGLGCGWAHSWAVGFFGPGATLKRKLVYLKMERLCSNRIKRASGRPTATKQFLFISFLSV